MRASHITNEQIAQAVSRQRRAARLRQILAPARQSGLDKQKTPEVRPSEVFTDAGLVLGVERGRYTECA